MSNALEKTGRRMDEALARVRQERAARRPSSPYPAPSVSASSFAAPEPAPVIPAVLLHRCVCAVFDLEWYMRYERQRSGRYRAIESIRIHDGDGVRQSATLSRTLRYDEIEGRHTPCPWCGDRVGTLYYCSCGAAVCGGRVKGNLFICRDSCGDQWEMGPPAREFQVIEPGQGPQNFRRPADRPAARSAPTRGVVNPARLLPPPTKGR
jgi:hypothetical protein